MAKQQLAALTITCLLGLLGSVACQGNTYSSHNEWQSSSSSSSSSSSPFCTLRQWLLFLPGCRDETPTPNPFPVWNPPLTVGYYHAYCPNAEGIVKKYVEKAIKEDPGVGAGLVRLFFHDCFVRGCDGSVLLRNTSGSSQQTEMFGLPNINSLRVRAFQVIDDAKAEIERACPRRVSCADIVAFAARDASRTLSYGAIDIKMPGGRLYGRVSLKEEAENNLPGPFGNISDLTKSFAAQGLSFHDMITLSGAHSIGVARCRFFTNRLPPNSSDMDHALAGRLKATCDANGLNSRVPQDPVTKDILDNQYYKKVHSGKVLFMSDDALNSTDDARKVVDGFARDDGDWYRAFADAMVKMGNIRDSTGGRPNQEIREKCWNYNAY